MAAERFVGLFFTVCILLIAQSSVYANNTIASFHPLVYCNEKYTPENCDWSTYAPLSKIQTLDDLERCGPAVLPIRVRNYFWAFTGRGITYWSNFAAFKKIRIIPKMLRDVSDVDISTTVLGQRIEFPVGLSPVAVQKLANRDGEIGSAIAASNFGNVMILSASASTSIEQLAAAVRSSHVEHHPLLWMQVYIFEDEEETIQLVKRAERSGYKAIVLTVDAPVIGNLSCQSNQFFATLRLPNFSNGSFPTLDSSITFQSITWLKRHTKLPIVVKGILNGEDAQKAVEAGASAIFVSNHGGRQLDSAPAAIDALPYVVKALQHRYPWVEVYIDGGVRSGYDVYKALARGARAAFVGRPIIWGLAIDGKDGVEKMLEILKAEFSEAMLLAGARSTKDIQTKRQRSKGLSQFQDLDRTSSRDFVDTSEYFSSRY